AQHSAIAGLGVVRTIAHPAVLTLAIVYFGFSGASYGLAFWLPQIVKAFGLTTLQTGLVSALPFLCGAVGMALWSLHSDATGGRLWHVVLPAAAAAAGLVAIVWLQDPRASIAAVCLAAFGVYAAIPAFWTLPAALLAGTGAAGGIAIINSIGNLAGFGG